MEGRKEGRKKGNKTGEKELLMPSSCVFTVKCVGFFFFFLRVVLHVGTSAPPRSFPEGSACRRRGRRWKWKCLKLSAPARTHEICFSAMMHNVRSREGEKKRRMHYKGGRKEGRAGDCNAF